MRVATWNIGDGSDDTKARGLSRLAFHGADVICLQEAGDRRKMIDHWCEATGWQAWLGDGSPGASSVPILWNPRAVQAVVTGTTPATDATNAGKRGAGPSVVKAKVWQRVRFEGRTVVINGHLPASLYLPGRRRLAVRMVAVLAGMVERRQGKARVIAVMDGNCNGRDRLWVPLRRLGLRQHTHAPTHGRRTIDLTWATEAGTAEVITMPSDHRAVILSVSK